MSDDPSVETPDPTEEPQEPVNEPQEPSQPQDQAPTAESQDGKPGSEAAKWRVQTRAAEARVSELEGQINAMRTAEAERLATTGDGPSLFDGTDLWRSGGDVSTLLTEDGAIDPAVLVTMIETLTESKTHLRADLNRHKPPKPDYSQGAGANRATPTDPGTGWQAILRAA